MNLVWGFLAFVQRRVTLPGDSDDEIARKVTVFVGAFAAAPIALGLAVIYPALGRPLAAIPALFYFGSYELAILYTLRSRTVEFLLYLSVAETLIFPFLGQWAGGGFQNSGGLSMIAIIGPFAAVYFNARGGWNWFLAYVILAVISGFLDPVVSAHGAQFPHAWRITLFVVNGLVTLTFIYIPLRYVMGELRRVRVRVEVERGRSDALLLNILPRLIADRLKGGEDLIADRFDEVTVLFTDLVGFTPLAAQLPAPQVVAMLNDLFTAYDDVADAYGLEKIKTVGDSFMACSGLPTPRADHAQAALAAAVALLERTRDYREATGLPLNLRIGLHSGPLVAGVIGKRKFAYDVYGDTVNIASRMESSGVPGRIQVSEATFRLLEDLYAFERREDVDIKGIGHMRTYLLVESSSAPLVSSDGMWIVKT